MPQSLSRLSAVISDIHASLSTRHILDASLKWAAQLLRAETAVIFLTQPHSSTLKGFVRKSLEKKPKVISFKLRPSQGLEAWIIATGKSTIVNNPESKNSFLKLTQISQIGPIQNFIAVPLKAKANPLGVIQLVNRNDHKSFTPKQLSFLELLAHHTATALTNATTYSTQHAFMSEQKKQLLSTTEQLRGANAKLRETDQTKSESISMVAHELRSPITSISGFAKILHHGKLGVLTKEQKDFCDIILKNAEHIHSLISDLLDLTKLELGKLEFHFEDVSCRELLKEAVFSVQGSTANEQQRIHMSQIPEDLFVEGDRLRLVQVLINLLSNALKYSPPNSQVLAHCTPEKNHVTFTITDRGASLTKEQQKRVFEKFYRIKKTGSHSQNSKAPGSGLGLAICKITVENHAGIIWADTPPDGGNAFHMKLKRTSGPAAPPL